MGGGITMYTIGLPNGSLYEPTMALLAKIGIKVNVSGRDFKASVEGTKLFKQAIIMRPQDIPEAIYDGMLDCGVCGLDCVCESELENQLAMITELGYAKKSLKPARIVAFSREKKLVDNIHILVTSEYPILARRVFSKATIRFSHGTTEAKVAFGKYDYGVGVVESGQSLRDNNLIIVKEIMRAPAVLMAKTLSPDLLGFGKLLKGAILSEIYVLVKMNVPQNKLNAVLKALPSLESPTISPLAKGGSAIETGVPKEQIADLIPKLSELGATGIVVQSLDVLY